MKSNFLKLCSILLCGVMFAAVGCTDKLAQDVQNVAKDVESVEKTLTDLQAKYNELAKAQSDLKALVDLKANVTDLDAKVRAVNEALAGKADATSVAALTETVNGLKSALEAAQSELSKYATVEALNGAKKELEDKIKVLDEAVKALQGAQTVAPADLKKVQDAVSAIETTVAGLATRIEAAEGKITAIEAKVATIETSIKGITDKLAGVDFEDFLTAEDVTAFLTAEDIEDLVGSEELDAAVDAIEAAGEAIAEILSLLNATLGELEMGIQSIVFVPSYDDLAATAYTYTFDDEIINDQVIVRATYKVTPAYLAEEIGGEAGYYAPFMFANKVATRAEFDPAVATAVTVSNVNPDYGTFDVEAIFNAAAFDLEKEEALTVALYLRENNISLLESDDVDPGFSVPTEVVDLEFAVSSPYVNLHINEPVAIEDSYRLVKKGQDGKYAEYETVTDAVEWSAAVADRAKSPFAGYEVRLELEDGKYTSLADAAEMMCVAVEAITPEYSQVATYMVAKDIKDFDVKDAADFKKEGDGKTCDINTVTNGEIAWDKVYSFAGEPVATTAKNFVGHKVAVEGVFELGDVEVINTEYNYVIDYRTVNLTIEGIEGAHEVAWNYEVANLLADKTQADKADWANAKELFATLAAAGEERYTEYGIKSTKGEFDYSDLLVGTPVEKIVASPAKVGTTTVVCPDVTITATTHLVADVAEVAVEDYNFYAEAVDYTYTATYIDNVESFSKVNMQFEFTLGEKPSVVEVSVDKEYAYTNKNIEDDGIKFKTLTAEAFEDYLSDECDEYSPLDDNTNPGINILEYIKAKDSNPYSQSPAADPTNLGYNSEKVVISAAHVKDVFLNAKDQTASLTKTAKTWYGVDFEYTVNFEITDPQYEIKVLPTYVASTPEGYFATTNYTYVANKYTVDDVNLAHYFVVDGVDGKNDVKVKFTVKTVDGSTGSPLINGGSPVERVPNAKGEFDSVYSILKWNNYNETVVDLEAQLLVNGEEFGEPVIITIIAEDPITSFEGKTVEVTREANDATTVPDVLKDVEIGLIGWDDKPITGRNFMDNASSSTKRHHTAYDAVITVDHANARVYYIEDGEKVALPSTNYTIAVDADGKVSISLLKESVNLLIPIYAEFDLELTYDLDGGEPLETTVQYVFEF